MKEKHCCPATQELESGLQQLHSQSNYSIYFLCFFLVIKFDHNCYYEICN